MRGMLQEKGINVDEKLGECETLYVREKDNKHLLSEAERFQRTTEAMMVMFGSTNEQIEALRSYVSGEKDINVIERAVKGEILKIKEKEAGNDEVEEVNLEEEDGGETRYNILPKNRLLINKQQPKIEEREIIEHNKRLGEDLYSKGNSYFSDIKVLIQNCQGYTAKKDYNKRLIEKLEPTLVAWSELKMREAEAMCIQDDHKGYNSVCQTPDMWIHDLKTRLEWKPNNGVAAMYDCTWGEKVEKVKILKRSVAITFKINKLRLMYFASYLPTNGGL